MTTTPVLSGAAVELRLNSIAEGASALQVLLRQAIENCHTDMDPNQAAALLQGCLALATTVGASADETADQLLSSTVRGNAREWLFSVAEQELAAAGGHACN